MKAFSLPGKATRGGEPTSGDQLAIIYRDMLAQPSLKNIANGTTDPRVKFSLPK